jgi:TPR repeat protein
MLHSTNKSLIIALLLCIVFPAFARGESAKELTELCRKYRIGDGVVKDEIKAFGLCKQAVEKGSPPAEAMLGHMYLNGIGTPRDINLAIHYTQKAADKNVPIAQGRLATYYFSGEYVPKDMKKSILLYTKAAENGDVASMAILCIYYNADAGDLDMVDHRDFQQAFKWCKKGADQGEPHSQLRLGQMYYNGQGVKRDRIKGEELIKKSAQQGNHDAINALKILENNRAIARAQAQNRQRAQQPYPAQPYPMPMQPMLQPFPYPRETKCTTKRNVLGEIETICR